jgi:hypothetical protein
MRKKASKSGSEYDLNGKEIALGLAAAGVLSLVYGLGTLYPETIFGKAVRIDQSIWYFYLLGNLIWITAALIKSRKDSHRKDGHE